MHVRFNTSASFDLMRTDLLIDDIYFAFFVCFPYRRLLYISQMQYIIYVWKDQYIMALLP